MYREVCKKGPFTKTILLRPRSVSVASPLPLEKQAGDQHRDGLAISCGHAAQYMATIGAIYGSGSNVDLKLYIFHGFSSQDKGQPGCIIPGSGAAAQATLGELASAGCKLV